MPHPDPPAPAIRAVRLTDAPAVAALTTELGYPVSETDQRRRLAALIASSNDAVLVATDAGDAPVAWIHVRRRVSLAADGEAQVMGLVVDARHRSAGLGSRLLTAAEAWARQHGARTMRVQSRLERERAHRFYERAGYRMVKTSRVFEHALGEEAASGDDPTE